MRKTTKSVENEAVQAIPERPRRVPISGPRDIMTVSNKDPNYVYRWVNDTENRIERFKLAGYEIVTSEHDIGMPTVDKVSDKFGSAYVKKVGGGLQSVLMRIPKEFYNEDQAAKQVAIDEIADQMKQVGKNPGEYGGVNLGRKSL